LTSYTTDTATYAATSVFGFGNSLFKRAKTLTMGEADKNVEKQEEEKIDPNDKVDVEVGETD